MPALTRILKNGAKYPGHRSWSWGHWLWVYLVLIPLLPSCQVRRIPVSEQSTPSSTIELPTTGKDLADLIFFADLEKIQQLAAQGVDFNVPMQNGEYPLFRAIWLDKPLVRHGAHLDLKNRQGQTALEYAIVQHRLASTESLLKLGADPNQRDQDGNTMLYLACKSPVISPQIVGLLLDYKADYQLTNSSGQTPLQALTWGRDLDLGSISGQSSNKLAHLVRAGYRPELPTNATGKPSLHELVKLVNNEILLRELIQVAKLDVNARDANSWTPLHIAIWQKHPNAAKALLKLGADPNAETTQPSLKKCLITGGNPRTGLGYKTTCRYKSPIGSRPLDIRPESLRSGWTETVQVIRQAGGRENPNLKPSEEFTEP
jgi:ankyrin repeat protein